MPHADAMGTRYWVLRTTEHWLRCDHADTALDGEQSLLTLARGRPPETAMADGDPAERRYGIAFDSCGRLWRAVPERGVVERVHDGNVVSIGDGKELPDAPADSLSIGGCPPGQPWLKTPRGIAIDDQQRLYIADEGLGRIIIIDLEDGRLVARMRPPSALGRASRPWDLCRDPSGEGAYFLDRGSRMLWRLRPDRAPLRILGPDGLWEMPGKESLHDPIAIAATCDGAVVVLDRDAPGKASVLWARRQDLKRVSLPAETTGLAKNEIDPATVATLAIDAHGDLFLGGDRGLSIARYRVEGAASDETRLELHFAAFAKAWRFDGGALATDLEGDVVFSTPEGFAGLSPAFPDYAREGRTITFALDSGIHDCVWHRVFFEACLPDATGLRVRTLTANRLDPPGPTLAPPEGYAAADMRPWEGTPVAREDDANWVELPGLLRRPGGADRPFYDPNASAADAQASDGEVGACCNAARHSREPAPALDLYEGLCLSDPGRYLWIELTLLGTDRRTPLVRGLRAYYPRPSYLRYLPEIYRTDPPAAAFLDRMLSLFEVVHSELDSVRDHMAVLFEPYAVPPEALDWLAGWLGLVLDPRWPEQSRRDLVARAAHLYRDRGTPVGLRDFIGLYLPHPFQIVEAFRTRRSGGVVVGALPEYGESIVGAGLVLNDPGALAKDTRNDAHRFTVFVAGELTDEERAVLEHIVEMEKPAHTLGEICDVTESCTVGKTLVGISTLVGKGRCFTPAVLGGEGFPVGRQVILGGGQGSNDRAMQVGTLNVGRNTVVR